MTLARIKNLQGYYLNLMVVEKRICKCTTIYKE